MEVKLLHENPDGSACYSFDLTEEEQQHFIRYGILEALKNGIQEAKKLACEGNEVPVEGNEVES